MAFEAPSEDQMDILCQEIVHDYLHGLFLNRTCTVERLFLEFWQDWEDEMMCVFHKILFFCTSYSFVRNDIRVRWFELALKKVLYDRVDFETILTNFLRLCAKKLDDVYLYKWLLDRYGRYLPAVDILATLSLLSLERTVTPISGMIKEITLTCLFHHLVKDLDISIAYALELMQNLTTNRDVQYVKRKISYYNFYKT